LFAICDALLEELNDGHVGIEASEKTMKKAAILGDWDMRPDADFKGVREAILTKYLKQPRRHNISKTVWGKLNDSTGYIQINTMGVQADFGIVDNTSPENAKELYIKYLERTPDTFTDDIDGMNATMKKVLIDLGDTQKIILDLRFNGGGEDVVGLSALSHLVGAEKTVFTKNNKVGESVSEAYPYVLTPQEKTYSGKVYLFQSHYSASATEVLLLASLSYENIVRIGSPSEGIFSDILEKKLPNGWEFGLSNEIYQDMNGISYEAKGIPVHVDLDYPKDEYEFVAKLKKDLATTGDTAIEHVLGEKIK
jgi:C-terminal processing protease CtpA/Prc